MPVARPAQLTIGALAASLLISGTAALSLVGTFGQSATIGRAELVDSVAGVTASGNDRGITDDSVSLGTAARSGGGGSGTQGVVGGRAGAATDARAAGAVGVNRRGPASSKGGATVGAGAATAVDPAAPQGSGGGHSGSDGGTPASGGGGGNTGPGGGGGAMPDAPGVPNVPTLATGGSLHAEGSLVVAVPPTAAMSKKLCLSGEVDSCKTITLPATPGTTLRVSYSGNTSAQAPTFAIVPCQGGTGATISGVTPGTIITVEVGSSRLTRTLGGREFSQTASLCDA